MEQTGLAWKHFSYFPAFFWLQGCRAAGLQKTTPEQINIPATIFRKMVKIAPIYLLSLALVVLCQLKQNDWNFNRTIPDFSALLVEASMLQMTGFFKSTFLNYAAWFVSSLLIGTTIILCFYKYIPTLITPLGVILVLFIYGYFYESPTLNSFKKKSPFFILDGNLRAIAGMFLGIFIFNILPQIANSIKGYKFIIIELILIIALTFLLFRREQDSPVTYYFLIIFPSLFLITLTQHSILARLLKSKFMTWLGGLSMYLYMTHVASIYFFKKVIRLPSDTSFLLECFVFIIFTLLVAIISKMVISCFVKVSIKPN